MVTLIGDPDGVPESRGGQSVRLFDTIQYLMARRDRDGGLTPEAFDAMKNELRLKPRGARLFAVDGVGLLREDELGEIMLGRISVDDYCGPKLAEGQDGWLVRGCDPAALLGPVREPVDWNPRDAPLIAVPGMPPDVLYDLRGATLVCEDDEPLGVYERDAAGDEEC